MAMTTNAVTATVVIASSVAAAVIDIRTRRVPNALTAATAIAGLAAAATGVGFSSLTGSVAGGIVGFGLLMPGYIWGGTGGGDVKLLAALGTLLGPNRIIVAF